LFKPRESTAALPQTVSGSRAVDNSRRVTWRHVLLVVAGKAMVVSIDKATALRTFDKVQRHWKERLATKETLLAAGVLDVDVRDLLAQEVAFMRQTDMALVISQSQNEVAEMAERGLDIRPHRKRMIEEDLESRFKDAQDPLRIAFVCSMWTTGFDVPSCSTMYLDKPMRNQTLMQTITRANRVFPEKNNGLIVGYVEILERFQKLLADYNAGSLNVQAYFDELVALSQALTQEEARALSEGLTEEQLAVFDLITRPGVGQRSQCDRSRSSRS
jgi:type I restriction enzyme, R subunit